MPEPIQPLTPGDKLPEQEATLIRALRKALAGIEEKLLERDALEMSGEVRRAAALKAQIDTLLERLNSKDYRAALAKPLETAFKYGGADVTIDRAKIKALVDAIADPLVKALPNAKSPLPYIAPKLDEADRKKVLELAIAGSAAGLTTKQIAQSFYDEVPGSQRLLQGEMERGATVKTEGGARVQAGRYAEMLARTTTYAASNQGVLARAEESGIETVKINVSPYAIDFCLDFAGAVLALTEAAAQKYGIPLLASAPNGGPPFHPNCRCKLAAFIPRKGVEVSGPPDGVMTREKGQGESQKEAEKSFQYRLARYPEKYAEQIGEAAAARGFGSVTGKTPEALVGEKIPGIVGKKQMFEKRALNEDIVLSRLLDAGHVGSRKELRYTVAQTLRGGSVSATNSGNLTYKKDGWTVEVHPKSGVVINAEMK